MSSILEIRNIESLLTYPREFLLCDFCFWAASAISTRKRDVMACPQCSAELSRIPLTEKESFTFSYDQRRGVELDFATAR